MQFNQISSPRSGIIQGIERTTKLGLGTISGNSAPHYYLDSFTAKVNEWLHIVSHWIHQVNDEWTYDDPNHVDEDGNVTMPIETYAFTDDQQDYGLDSDITKLRLVEAHDAAKTEPEGWYDLDYQYEKDRVEDQFGLDKDKPSKYYGSGRSLIFDVPIDITKADKYRLTYDRHSHEFAIDDTTQEPGFDKQFHWILVYGPSMDWAEENKVPEVVNICMKKLFGAGEGDPRTLKTMLEEHYAKQDQHAISLVGRKYKTYE